MVRKLYVFLLYLVINTALFSAMLDKYADSCILRDRGWNFFHLHLLPPKELLFKPSSEYISIAENYGQERRYTWGNCTLLHNGMSVVNASDDNSDQYTILNTNCAKTWIYDGVVYTDSRGALSHANGAVWVHNECLYVNMSGDVLAEYNISMCHNHSWVHSYKTLDFLKKIISKEAGCLDCSWHDVVTFRNGCRAAASQIFERRAAIESVELQDGWCCARGTQLMLRNPHDHLVDGASNSDKDEDDEADVFEDSSVWFSTCGGSDFLRVRLGEDMVQYNLSEDERFWGDNIDLLRWAQGYARSVFSESHHKILDVPHEYIKGIRDKASAWREFCTYEGGNSWCVSNTMSFSKRPEDHLIQGCKEQDEYQDEDVWVTPRKLLCMKKGSRVYYKDVSESAAGKGWNVVRKSSLQMQPDDVKDKTSQDQDEGKHEDQDNWLKFSPFLYVKKTNALLRRGASKFGEGSARLQPGDVIAREDKGRNEHEERDVWMQEGKIFPVRKGNRLLYQDVSKGQYSHSFTQHIVLKRTSDTVIKSSQCDDRYANDDQWERECLFLCSRKGPLCVYHIDATFLSVGFECRYQRHCDASQVQFVALLASRRAEDETHRQCNF